MTTRAQAFDVLILGGEQKAFGLAEALAVAGKRTAWIEPHVAGRSLAGYERIATRTLAASAAAADRVRRAGSDGIVADAPTIDWTGVRRHMWDAVTSVRAHKRRRLEQLRGVARIEGEASFVDSHALQVRRPNGTTQQLEAGTIVIDTGSRPSIPPIEGMNEIPTLDPTSILELPEIPEHLAVLGGGTAGIELAQVFRRLGAAVSVVEQVDHILPREDADVARELGAMLCDEGVTLRTGFTVMYLERLDDRIRIVGARGDRGLCILCTHVLVASDPVPRTERLRLQAAGIRTTGRGSIVVDERLETSVPGVYAIGDARGEAPSSCTARDDVRLLIENLVDGRPAGAADRISSRIVHTDPQLRRIGLTEADAVRRNLPCRVAKVVAPRIPRAIGSDRPEGIAKALIDPASKRIVGAAAVGARAAGLTSLLHLAMIADLPYPTLVNAPLVDPADAETLEELFASWADR